MTLQFQNRVAIVTGAGNGIGKAYAIALSQRGAKVLVNDVGCDRNGHGAQQHAADLVVKEITQKGGKAIPDYHSVEEAEKIVKHAIQVYGRVDILINNAAIIRDCSFLKMKELDWDMLYRVSLLGTYRMCKAVWPWMRRQKYGRIINTVSAAGLYGNFGQAGYAAMKMGIYGLSNVLCKEGRKYTIYVNTVSPIAGTRLTETVLPDDLIRTLKPEFNVPFVLYLCHDTCQENGGLFEMGGGWAGKLRYERSQGAAFALDDSLTPEHVANRWNEVIDFSRVSHPQTTQEAFEPIMQNITAPPDQPRGLPTLLRCSAIFERLNIVLEEEGEQLVQKIGGIIQWNIGSRNTWTIDLSRGNGMVLEGTGSTSPNVIFTTTEPIFFQICSGQLSPQQALLQRKMKIEGNLKYAMKLEPLIDLLQSKAKL